MGFFLARGLEHARFDDVLMPGNDYKYDGIEGYVFDKAQPQPAGSVKLLRWYKGMAFDDHAIFPDTLAKKDAMTAAGYADEPGHEGEFLGYVYLNQDTDGDGLTDGFERFIGTNPSAANSDCDAVPDGQEFPLDGLQIGDPKSVPVLALTNHTVTEREYACAKISAGTGYRVASGGNLSLGAGQLVELRPGFSVAKGGRLSAGVSAGP